ncbi:hypothetical protein [Actinomadura sp. HBU206391]|uniref:hypothetical protein n=1 Tax=Actinomadura sp. HBU206391 TaxID=2731692 RepID=UPI00164FB5F5|nr:hypothetical protein [Actinomadura sp. HBU206391]MBC6456375.1 hypothetical protein [Actinomadura sp. HBU206391]
MVILDAKRRNNVYQRWQSGASGVGMVATVGANVAHGLNRGVIGALVNAWPVLALVGSFELLMTLIRAGSEGNVKAGSDTFGSPTAPSPEPSLPIAPV